MKYEAESNPPAPRATKPAKESSSDEPASARDKACHKLAALLGVPDAKYEEFRRLLRVATDAED